MEEERLPRPQDFPSFSEGLSLRDGRVGFNDDDAVFPFLFGGTFIEGLQRMLKLQKEPMPFPFLFGGTFIEGT